MTQQFRGEPSRDAAAAIRGFVYQLDWSVLRWLRLNQGEAIELEAGEDIDVIAPNLLDPDASHDRIMMALKNVSGTITLNTRDAIAAVAHLAGHRQRNPEHRISMVFVTTASIARERSSPFAGRVAALDVWNAARTARALTDSQADGIRAILQRAKRPKRAGVSDEDWDALQAAIRDPGGVEPLVMGLEWTASAPRGSHVVDDAVDLLSHHLPTPEQARRAHRYLFHFMLRGLLQGQKRYDQSALAEALAAFPRDEGVEDAVRVRDSLVRIEAEIDAVSGRVDSLEAVVAAVLGDGTPGATPLDLEKMALSDGTTLVARLASRLATHLPTPARPSLTPPPKSPAAVARIDTSLALTTLLEARPWVHIHGSIRTGKTTLVRQVVDHRASCAWVRVRGLSEEQVLSRVREAWGDATEDAAEAVASLMSRDGLLVIDDVPDPEHCVELFETLLAAVDRVAGRGRIITIGSRRLPGRADDCQMRVPPFTAAEVRELLSHHGAPNDVLQNGALLQHIRAVTNGHPERLRHAIEVLKRVGWNARNALAAMFAPQADEGEVTRVLRLVDSTVPNLERRALLYRLCVYAGSFDANDATRLANLPQPIGEPRAHVALLEGLWLEVDAPTTWTVSPAVRPFGASQLSSETLRAVHRQAAERYLERGTLTMLDALRTAEHLEQGGETDRAGGVAARALMAMIADQRLDHDPGFVFLWPELPRGMSPSTRLWVRGAQLRAAHAKGLPIAVWIEWLDRELSAAGADPVRLFTALMVHGAVVTADPARAAQWVLEAAGSGRDPGTDATVAEILEHSVFLHAWHLARPEHLASWLDLLELLAPEARARVAGRTGMALAFRQAMGDMWLKMNAAAVDRAEWSEFLATLERVEARATTLHLPMLAAAAIRTRVIILCEEFAALESAVELASRRAGDFELANRALLLDESGRQLIYKRRDPQGLPYLRQALVLYPPGPDYDTERYNACLIACEAAGRLELHADAVSFGAAAVDLAIQPDSDIPSEQRTVAHAEHAVALWRSGQRRATLPALEAALLALLQVEDRDDVWRTRFVLLAHSAGFFASVAATGRPPDRTADGSAYLGPEPGMYRNRRTDLAARFDASTAAALPASVLRFAIEARAWERVALWANRTVELAVATATIDPTTPAHEFLAIEALLAGDVDRGLSHFVSAARAIAWTLRLIDQAAVAASDDAIAVLARLPEPVRATMLAVVAENAAYAVASVLAGKAPEERREAVPRVVAWLDSLYRLSGDPCIVDAAAVMRAFVPGEDHSALREIAARDPSQSDPGPWGLAQLVLGVVEASSVSDALVRHIHASRVVEMKRGTLGLIYDLAVTPFYVNTWREVARTAGFRLRSPSVVRSALAEIGQSNSGNEIRSTLVVMVDALGLRVDPQLRSWLAEVRSSPLDT